MLLLLLAFTIDGDELGSVMKNIADHVKLSEELSMIVHSLGRGVCLHHKTTIHIIITQPIAWICRCTATECMYFRDTVSGQIAISAEESTSALAGFHTRPLSWSN